jgi:hypothetical protein
MTEKQFINAVSNRGADLLQILLDILSSTQTPYCVIGGLAVNAYVEPVVSLDIDLVVAVANQEAIKQATAKVGFKIEQFPDSVNLNRPESDLRIQLQTDPRYQDFIAHAQVKTVLGYEMKVARLHDLLQGKIWAYQDLTRRKSKRQKDLADILRLVESYPELKLKLPPELQKVLD